MVGFVTQFLKQKATWWHKTGIDGFGNVTFTSPTPIVCRWEDRSEIITNAEGAQVPSRSRVWTAIDITIGDWLKLGTSNTLDPQDEDMAFMVQDFRKIPSLDATDFERLSFL